MAAADARLAFERGTGFLLARLGSLAARSWLEFLAQRGLTQMHYATLMVLAEDSSLGQRRLAQLVAVDPRNLVAVLDQLAARGLVVRDADATDHRRRNVRLTATGTRLIRALASDAAASRDRFLGSLTLDQRKQLNILLRQLYDAHADEQENASEPAVAATATFPNQNSSSATDRRTPGQASRSRDSAEIYPEVVDGVERKGGVPSRLIQDRSPRKMSCPGTIPRSRGCVREALRLPL